MILKNKLRLLLFLLTSCMVFSQSKKISGSVISVTDNLPIPGVSIVILNSKVGATTDFDGNFTIEASKGDILQFSYVGFASQVITIADQNKLEVRLIEKVNELEQVVVVGYGTQKKSHLTGAISKVVNEKLDQVAVTRVDDALVGQIAGVNVQATEGDAGSAPTIRIRGTGSITGSSAPLIVVDGLAVDSDFLGSLNMNDVESFEVLKDAASSAIYGSRGANGVIMITTKQGKEGKTKFSYNSFTGYKTARKSEAYTFSVAETAARELAATGGNSDRTRYIQLIGVDNDWQNIVFNGGLIENHAFSARGGSERTKFSASFNYLHDEGVLLTDDYKRYTANFKLDTKLTDKLTFGANLSPSFAARRRFDGSTHDILRQPSWLPLYLDEHTIQFVNRLRDNGRYANAQIGDYAVQRMFDDYDLVAGMPVASGGTDISDTSNTNPGAKVLEKNRTDDKFKMFGNLFLQYKLAKGLTFKTVLAGDFQNTKARRWQGILSGNNGPTDAQLDLATENRIHLVTENYFSYNKTFHNHEIDAVAGYSAEKWDTESDGVTGTGYTNDLVQTISGATLIASAFSTQYKETLMSFFGRVNYSYQDKYFLSASYRRDGSSRFGPNNKYGDFPAVSLGWNIAKEAFLVDSNFFTNLKFRASYGFTGNKDISTGNDLIDNYPAYSLLSPSISIINNAPQTGYNPINVSNPDLRWERSREINLGLDFGFYKNVVTGSVDVYNRTSDQLLLFNPISYTTGFSNGLVNLGKVSNEGIEIEIRTRNISNEKFKWTTSFIASKNVNELVNFGDSDGQIQNVDDKRAAEWINLVGNPISSFYGWVVDRDIPLEYITNPYFPINAEAQDVYVKDLNGDGLIDDDDKTILGSPYPDFIWSITNEFKISNFDFSFMFQGSHGAEVRNMGDQYLFNHFNSAQDYIASTTPNQGFIKEKIFTNDIIQDASYIALRNINLGYNLPQNFTTKLGFISNARIYATAQNVLYFTADGYTGFNPESIDNTSPTTYGYQRGGLPIFSTISFGVNLDF